MAAWNSRSLRMRVSRRHMSSGREATSVSSGIESISCSSSMRCSAAILRGRQSEQRSRSVLPWVKTIGGWRCGVAALTRDPPRPVRTGRGSGRAAA
eukprot:5227258-Prymnesium_polylepis.1